MHICAMEGRCRAVVDIDPGPSTHLLPSGTIVHLTPNNALLGTLHLTPDPAYRSETWAHHRPLYKAAAPPVPKLVHTPKHLRITTPHQLAEDPTCLAGDLHAAPSRSLEAWI